MQGILNSQGLCTRGTGVCLAGDSYVIPFWQWPVCFLGIINIIIYYPKGTRQESPGRPKPITVWTSDQRATIRFRAETIAAVRPRGSRRLAMLSMGLNGSCNAEPPTWEQADLPLKYKSALLPAQQKHLQASGSAT